MDTNRITLGTLLNTYSSIVIPDIQRDYIMGSGGIKLKNLLDAMRDAYKKNVDFNFSCIMGHVNPRNNTLSIYDGQQRIVTLIYLCAYLCQDDLNHKQTSQLLKKFKFLYRKEANDYLHSLLIEQNPTLSIVDFTTFSINNLICAFEKRDWLSNPSVYSNYKNEIPLDFLLNHIYMESVLIDEIGDVEQFFIDLNDGLDLKEYEIYKAELYHKAKRILGNDFNNFALSMENEWLQFFRNYKSEACLEEEIEILFVKFCLYMMWNEEEQIHDNYDASDIDWIEAKHLKKVEEIINNMLQLDLNEIEVASCINYSFSTRNRKDTSDIHAVEGVFWNLEHHQYASILHTFLKSFCNNTHKGERDTYKIKDEATHDAIIWAYISNLDKNEKELHEYLRSIKLFLNKNIIENNTAYYDKEHDIWYTAYSAYGIPTYYSKLDNSFARFNKENEQCNSYLKAVIRLNKHFNHYISLNKEIKTNNNRLAKVIYHEQKKHLSNSYEEIKQLENLPFINGFVKNLLDENGDPIITMKELKERLGFVKNNPTYLNEVIGTLLNQFSYVDVVELEKHIFRQSLCITWRAYTDNWSSYKQGGKLVLQTLTDLFVAEDLRGIIQAWIKRKNHPIDQPLDDTILFMRAYQYIPEKGFGNENLQVITVKPSDVKKGLYSSAPKFGYPYTSYNLKDHINLINKDMNLSNCENDIKYSIEYQIKKDWLKLELEKNMVYYCDTKWLYFVFLDEYTKTVSSGKQDIMNMVANNKEVVRFIHDKYYFIPYVVMSAYLNRQQII
ncbi:DUF262 domain-containing protein [Lysinibacillus sp. fls2-241-R2A-57]|uniref:DUF262 domain-containing protein n=1 Tax=Lysinibacillus sp. fls2-241-R2A-57 TaxID=3040292 RepID=UPI00255275BC|nr:DUF262 domain-containing protein [Lysinibacillus sp. fls2-241-R2A-57]